MCSDHQLLKSNNRRGTRHTLGLQHPAFRVTWREPELVGLQYGGRGSPQGDIPWTEVLWEEVEEASGARSLGLEALAAVLQY